MGRSEEDTAESSQQSWAPADTALGTGAGIKQRILQFRNKYSDSRTSQHNIIRIIRVAAVAIPSQG